MNHYTITYRLVKETTPNPPPLRMTIKADNRTEARQKFLAQYQKEYRIIRVTPEEKGR